MKRLAGASLALSVIACGTSNWPEEDFPAGMSINRVLFAENDSIFMQGCSAVIAELTENSARRVIYAPGVLKGGPYVASPANGWSPTPVPEKAAGRAFYEGAFGGCNNDNRRPLGDLSGALKRPGSFYKVINGGEGILVIVPHAKLAGFFYFG